MKLSMALSISSVSLNGDVHCKKTTKSILVVFSISSIACNNASSLDDVRNQNLFAGSGVVMLPVQENDPSCVGEMCNIDKICKAGFKILALKITQLTNRDAKSFYSIHSEKPFFNDLVKFITRGPVVVMVLKKENAVDDFRTLIGSTNPEEAAEGTIRNMFAKSVGENAIHGSDSDQNAFIESSFHFSNREIFNEI